MDLRFILFSSAYDIYFLLLCNDGIALGSDIKEVFLVGNIETSAFLMKGDYTCLVPSMPIVCF